MSTGIGSNRPFLKVSVLVGIIMLAFWVAAMFPDLVILLISSVLVAFVLKPLVKMLEFRLGLRRSIAIACVFIVVGGLVALVAIEAVPFLINRLQTMYQQFRVFPFEVKLNEAAQRFAKDVPFLDATTIAGKINQYISDTLQSVGGGLENAFGYLATVAIVPFVTYFILAEGDHALKKLIERVPNKYFEMTLNVLNKIERDLVGYLRGWILDSVIIGLLSVVAMYAIGIDYPILIGTVAGVANLIPYLGPIVGAVPAFMVSLTQYGDFRMLLPIAAATFLVQLIDNIVVQPLCYAKTVDMHPLTVIIVLVIGNQLMGVMGMLLAIPIATVLKVSAIETYWGLRHYRITAT